MVFESSFSSEIGHTFRALSCAFVRGVVLSGGSKEVRVFCGSLPNLERISKTVRVGCVQW